MTEQHDDTGYISPKCFHCAETWRRANSEEFLEVLQFCDFDASGIHSIADYKEAAKEIRDFLGIPEDIENGDAYVYRWTKDQVEDIKRRGSHMHSHIVLSEIKEKANSEEFVAWLWKKKEYWWFEIPFRDRHQIAKELRAKLGIPTEETYE